MEVRYIDQSGEPWGHMGFHVEHIGASRRNERHSGWYMARDRLNFPYPQLYPELRRFGDLGEQERILRACNGYIPYKGRFT